MPNIAEITKGLYKHIQDNLNVTIETIYPYQDKQPSLDKWIMVHILDISFIPMQKNEEIGSFILNIGVFSKESDVYSVDNVCNSLYLFLHKINISTTNYILRCLEARVIKMYQAGQNIIEKQLKHNVFEVVVNIYKK